MFEAWRSVRTQPASRSTLRWWLIVGWATSQHAVKSQAQTPPPAASWRRMARRLGSAAPWRRSTSGSVWRFIPENVLTGLDIVKYQYADTRETPSTRERLLRN